MKFRADAATAVILNGLDAVQLKVQSTVTIVDLKKVTLKGTTFSQI